MRDPGPGSSFFQSSKLRLGGKVEMETNCPEVLANPSSAMGGYHDHTIENEHPQWLLELDTDGTIRHSSSHPGETVAGNRSLIGSNFFDLDAVLGDLSDLKRNFFGFVKSERNRETSCLQTHNGSEKNEAIIVLTRSYDTSRHERKEIVLMEIRV